MRHAPLTLLVSIVCASSVAFAQEARGYAGGGAMLSAQGANPICQNGSGCPRPAIGGTAWGIVAEIGGRVAPAISVGAEVSVPGRLETVQQTAISNQRTDQRHRDATIL